MYSASSFWPSGSSIIEVTIQNGRPMRSRAEVISGTPAMPELTMIRSKSASSGRNSICWVFQTTTGAVVFKKQRVDTTPFVYATSTAMIRSTPAALNICAAASAWCSSSTSGGQTTSAYLPIMPPILSATFWATGRMWAVLL